MKRLKLLAVSIVFMVLAILSTHDTFGSVSTDINLKFKSNDIFVFKNGVGLVLKSGKVTNFDGTAITDDFPDAMMGSIITYVDDEAAKIKGVTAYKENVSAKSEITSIDALLKENVGKKVKVLANDTTITGTLKIAGADFIIVSHGDENVLLKKADIKSISVLGEMDTKTESSREEKRLRFDIDSKKTDLNISLGYLRKGLRWIPLYKIDIKDGKAKITLDAQIVNDGEDITDASFYLVVGAPNFMFSEENNPFSLKEVAAQVISGAIRTNRNRFSNLNMSNALMSQSASFGNVINQLAPSGGDEKGDIGTTNEDTFVYELKGIKLKKGERMIVNLFNKEVDYTDIYKLDMVDKITSASGRSDYWNYSSARVINSAEELTLNKVWHNLRLENSTSFPWTTGVATVFKDNMPISQDLLRYTPSGTDCDLKLMISSDIFVRESGTETKREKGEGHYYWAKYFDRVTVKADITITNNKGKDVRLEVMKSFYGDDVYASKDGKITKTAMELLRVNPREEIKWTYGLKSKKAVTLDYGFTTWVRR